MNHTADHDFIKQTLGGDTQAFGFIVEKYQGFIFTIVLRMVKVREEAEEISQDTFIKAFESLSSYRGESKFSSWLYSIAYRKAIDHIRKKKRHFTSELIKEITENKMETIENALGYLEEKERKDIIQQSILQLSKKEAAIITLYYFEDQSVKEIRTITGLSEDNIKIKLYRSRKKLFNLLKHYVLPEITNRNGKAI